MIDIQNYYVQKIVMQKKKKILIVFIEFLIFREIYSNYRLIITFNVQTLTLERH